MPATPHARCSYTSDDQPYTGHMFLPYRPSDRRICAFIDSHRTSQLSYPEVGASREGGPAGDPTTHIRYQLGVGLETYTRAAAALQRWTMYKTSWTWLCWPETPVEAGATVAVLARHFGFWSLNPVRIVYVLQEDQPLRRYGFAVGTLPGHAEQGEERF